jgi:hypothetical protein
MLGKGLGLTCSTFVLTVFESAKISLVNVDGWPIRPDDDQRHEAVLEKMRRGIPNHAPPAPPEHVDRVAAELPCIRVRPEEVVASGIFDDLPVAYAQLEPAGQFIVARLSKP